MDSKRYFKNQYIEMFIEDGILKSAYFDGVIVDLEAAITIIKDRIEFLNGESFPTYIDARKVKYWTKDARKFHELNNNGMTAAALHVGSHVMKTIFRFYILIHKPDIPQNCFTNKQDALRWLKQFK